MAFDADGVPIKGIAPLNNWLRVELRGSFGWGLDMLLSRPCRCLGSWAGPTTGSGRPILGTWRLRGPNRFTGLGGADLVVVDEDALGLAFDVEVLLGVMEQLPARDPRRHEILRALERCLDLYDLDEDAACAPASS